MDRRWPDRPRPERLWAIGRIDHFVRNDRGRTFGNGWTSRSQLWGSTEVEPCCDRGSGGSCETCRSRSSNHDLMFQVLSPTEVEGGSRVAMPGRVSGRITHQLPARLTRPASPKGGRRGGTSPTRPTTAEAGGAFSKMVSIPHRSGDRAAIEVRARERKVLSQRGCASTIPRNMSHPRVLVLVIRADIPILDPEGAGPKSCGSRKGDRSSVGTDREAPMGNAEALRTAIAFYPTLVSAV